MHPAMFINKHLSTESEGICDEMLLFPSGVSFYGCITQIFLVKIRLRHVILELCYRNETRMP
jgi:hypothetical protein